MGQESGVVSLLVSYQKETKVRGVEKNGHYLNIIWSEAHNLGIRTVRWSTRVALAAYASAGIMATATNFPTFVLWCSHLHLVRHLQPIALILWNHYCFYPLGNIPEAGLCRLTQPLHHLRSSPSLFTLSLEISFALYLRSSPSIFTFALYLR